QGSSAGSSPPQLPFTFPRSGLKNSIFPKNQNFSSPSSIKVKAPAKINITLEVLNKREDGYHNIESIMQAVSLYDYLTISVENSERTVIEISGNNTLIPYDKTNLAYKSAEKYLDKAGIINKKINIYIEKYIPVAAGLAGGSSNAAAVLFGLNKIFNNPLKQEILSALASEIGADVNFCLYGGTQMATSRGEILKPIETPHLNIIIVKPKDLFISAKEAYDKYSKLKNKLSYQPTEFMLDAIKQNNPEAIAKLIHNVLEDAILPDYPQIQKIKQTLIKAGCLNVIMSGSGPSVFGILPDDRQRIDINNCDLFYVSTLTTGIVEFN
ncbi:MAG: 4-(cytidine 5'-diphospho)-2-C-methyl-D-erythritol kinase, partial [Candidatus Gastranaerophilales bacterium]|nr:4-(cytidine 5'-diphospho)-2-C-methyl-D-erythritol kinase [Candidatus Gastranaerophilales bacterium]